MHVKKCGFRHFVQNPPQPHFRCFRPPTPQSDVHPNHTHIHYTWLDVHYDRCNYYYDGCTTTMMMVNYYDMCNYYDGCTTMMCVYYYDYVTNYEECFYFCVEWGGVHPDIHYICIYTTYIYTLHMHTHNTSIHIYIYTLTMMTLLLWWCVTTMMIYYYVVGGVNHYNVWMNNPKQTASALGVRSSTMIEVNQCHLI